MASTCHTFVLQSWPVEMTVSLSSHTKRVICDCGWAFLMIVCLDGFATDQMMMAVSSEPLATNCEFGDHATQLTLALWKPHSCLCAGCLKVEIKDTILLKWNSSTTNMMRLLMMGCDWWIRFSMDLPTMLRANWVIKRCNCECKCGQYC